MANGIWYVKRDSTSKIVYANPTPNRETTEAVDSTNPDLIVFLATPVPPSVAAVRAEAERRISSGILVNGKPFRCDDQSVLRMRELKDALAAAAPGATQTFKTAAGDTFTVTAAQAAAIADAQRAYRGAVLARSTALQDSPPANIADDAHWPAKMRVTLT